MSEWNGVGVGIEKAVEEIKDSIPKVKWDFEGIHYFDNGPLTVQYLFVLDALNFCFWPGDLRVLFLGLSSCSWVYLAYFSLVCLLAQRCLCRLYGCCRSCYSGAFNGKQRLRWEN